MIVEKLCDLKKETRRRVRKMKKEFEKEPAIKVFDNAVAGYNQMIIQKGIPFMSMCEHHHVAFMGDVTIGYIPDKKVIGLSKLARIAEYFFNPTKPTLQERGTQQIADYLWDNLKPLGVMVVARATHGCIAYRGVKKPSETITSAIRGAFERKETRQEFLSLTTLK